jgi:hypothetical protein
MLKRWWTNFNPTQDYFHLRHIWVLLPDLPLHLWNQQALESIGNSLGRYIGVEPLSPKSSDRKLEKFLVEIDIHNGVLETIDIEWRGHTIRQNLDYLGIPFRCTLCRRTGHLRNVCTGHLDEELSKDTMLDLENKVDSPDINSQPFYPKLPESRDLVDATTISGKLKSICPSLYNSLTSWENNYLDFATSWFPKDPSSRPERSQPQTPLVNPPLHSPFNTLEHHLPPTMTPTQDTLTTDLTQSLTPQTTLATLALHLTPPPRPLTALFTPELSFLTHNLATIITPTSLSTPSQPSVPLTTVTSWASSRVTPTTLTPLTAHET